MKKTTIILLLILILLLTGVPLGAAAAEGDPGTYSIETEPAAQNLTGRCQVTSDLKTTAYTWRVTDAELFTAQVLEAGQRVSLTWREDVPVKAVYLAFKDYPEAYRIQQFDEAGALLKEEVGPHYVNHAVFLEEGTRTVTVFPDSQIVLCSFYAYGEGAIPDYHPWAPVPEKLDYLIVAMHPDDDVLFMGAIIPLYTVEQGREGSIFYTATMDRVRKDEAQNGAWAMGLRTAFKCHRSQRKSRHKVRNEGAYSMSDFGLAYTVVGLDTPDLNDPFEHIDPATIHGSGPPPSSPTTVTDNSVP